jgi:DNA-binding NarL/FixJ family response regulator
MYAAMKPITILIVDDHEDLRRVLVRRLHSRADFVVVGDTASPLRGMELAAVRRPDIILFDAPTPGPYAAELCARIVKASPESRLVVFTSFLDDESESAYHDAGAVKCILKEMSVAKLAAELAGVVNRVEQPAVNGATAFATPVLPPPRS